MQDALNQSMLIFLYDMGQKQWIVLLGILAALRTNRSERIEQVTAQADQPPIKTVGQQGGIILPTGLGIGATQVGWVVISIILAAGSVPMITVADAFRISPGPAGTHGIKVQGFVLSVIRAAGGPPINTVNSPVTMGKGNAGCGITAGTGAAGWMGA